MRGNGMRAAGGYDTPQGSLTTLNSFPAGMCLHLLARVASLSGMRCCSDSAAQRDPAWHGWAASIGERCSRIAEPVCVCVCLEQSFQVLRRSLQPPTSTDRSGVSAVQALPALRSPGAPEQLPSARPASNDVPFRGAGSKVPRILLMGMRRSGKTSIFKECPEAVH